MVAATPGRTWLRGVRFVRGLHGTPPRALQRHGGRPAATGVCLQLLHRSSRSRGSRARAVSDLSWVGSELSGVGRTDGGHPPPVVLRANSGRDRSLAGLFLTGLELQEL